jgi:hypothetical protein
LPSASLEKSVTSTERASQQALVLAKLLDSLVGGIGHSRDIRTVLTVTYSEVQLILFNGYNKGDFQVLPTAVAPSQLALPKGACQAQIVAPVVDWGSADAEETFATAEMGTSLD